MIDQASRNVVGAPMLGEDSPEIPRGLPIAINAGATEADFGRTVGIHPTAAEALVTMRTLTRVAVRTTGAEFIPAHVHFNANFAFY